MTEYQEVRCLDYGYVALIEATGDDRTPAKIARTSYRNRNQTRSADDDAKLTRYLMNHRHSTPFEFIQLAFYIKAPIFVARQFMRHRTQSINEVSYRYVTASREYYVPHAGRMQRKSESNKQGSSPAVVMDPEHCRQVIVAACERAFDAYESLLAEELAPELARSVLPVATYTEWACSMNMHNLLHMLELRLDSHAQHEIQVYAYAMLELVANRYPGIIKAWQARLNDQDRG